MQIRLKPSEDDGTIKPEIRGNMKVVGNGKEEPETPETDESEES